MHAVAAGSQELEAIRKRGASVAWCPSSNLFTLGRTLSADALRSGVRIALGTDSAMTAEGDMIDEMRVARTSGGLTAEEIYPSVTTNAAQALRLTDGQGAIREARRCGSGCSQRPRANAGGGIDTTCVRSWS